MDKVIVIVGPTSSGKTALSIKIAKTLGGEVVSADSRQVYRGLDIGTGKIIRREMRGVPHHLLDIADPKATFTASDYVCRGREAIAGIVKRKHVPIIAGGTGFYIDTLLGRRGITEVGVNEALREKLRGKSLEKLQIMLKKLDPARYKTIDTKNPVRLVRAIEIARALGRVPAIDPKPIYKTLFIGISIPKEKLDKKIHIRLFARIRGIEKEVKKLHSKGLSWKRMEALGLEYRYMARYLQAKITKEEMLVQLENEIKQYARRQMTWFKPNKEIHWVTNNAEALRLAKQFCE